MPTQSTHQIKANKDGSVLIEYHPTDTGVHEVSLNYNDQQLEGTCVYISSLTSPLSVQYKPAEIQCIIIASCDN